MLARTVILLPMVGCAAILFAQGQSGAEKLTQLRLNAEQKTSAWFALHQAMEGNLTRLLPCDQRVKTTIEDVNRASDARLDAWTRYLTAWRSETAAAAVNAKAAIARHRSELDSIQAESEQLVEELSDLRRRRAALPPGADAIRTLDEIIDLTSQRTAAFADRRGRLQAAGPLLNDLLSPAQATADAVAKEAEQLPALTSKWRAYYAARIHRAETECGITGQPVKPLPTRRRKKQ